MEVIFKAKDGTMFNSADACVQYEVELANSAKDWEAWGVAAHRVAKSWT